MFAPGPFKMALQFSHMIVWKDAQERAAEFCAVDQRGVAELVEYNDVIFGNERRDRAERGRISAGETKRGFCRLPLRFPLISREAPEPTPNSFIPAIAASRNRGSFARPR